MLGFKLLLTIVRCYIVAADSRTC